MNEYQFAKNLRTNYDKALKQNNDFINLIGNISEYNGLNYNTIKEECRKFNLTFMTCQEAKKLTKRQDTKELYLSETNNYIYFDNTDTTKGIE